MTISNTLTVRSGRLLTTSTIRWSRLYMTAHSYAVTFHCILINTWLNQARTTLLITQDKKNTTVANADRVIWEKYPGSHEHPDNKECQWSSQHHRLCNKYERSKWCYLTILRWTSASVYLTYVRYPVLLGISHRWGRPVGDSGAKLVLSYGLKERSSEQITLKSIILFWTTLLFLYTFLCVGSQQLYTL